MVDTASFKILRENDYLPSMMTSRQAFGFLSDPGYYVFSVFIYVYL